MYNGNLCAPVGSDVINACYGQVSPSTLHCKNTALTSYFKRYLLQKAMSVFKWELPKEWSKSYFLYTLYTWGFISVVETDKFGVICQGCGLQGYNIYYQPTHAVIVNPLLQGFLTPQIGLQCELIRLTPDWVGITDIISYYADNMALSAESALVNIANSKLAYVFSAKNKNGAESLKKVMDDIMSGNTAVFYDEKLKNRMSDGSEVEPWNTFSRDLKGNYIANDLQDTMRRWEELFDNDIGINNVRSDKKERLITSEAEANNFEAKSKCELWLECLKESIEKVNKMFGLEISVDWRDNNVMPNNDVTRVTNI